MAVSDSPFMSGRRSVRAVLRILAAGLGLGMLFAAATTDMSRAADGTDPPTATQIEHLLREALTGTDPYLPPAFRTATLLEFRLRRLDRLSGSRWTAETDLLFDFGAPPAAVVGFERLRNGSYRLVLVRDGNRLRLMRFTPEGQLNLMPAI